jgi:hypothetical protein
LRLQKILFARLKGCVATQFFASVAKARLIFTFYRVNACSTLCY